MKALLEIQDLLIGYTADCPVLPVPFSVNVSRGSLTGIIGPNGAGKTTLMKTLCTLLPPLSGFVSINGHDIREMKPAVRAKNICYILPNTSVIPNIPVSDVVAMGRFAHTGWIGKPGAEDQHKCLQAIEKAGITYLTEKRFHNISDGEKQRVLFAMAIAQDSPLILFDEPAAFLDVPARNQLYSHLYRLTREENKTILFTTHDIPRALERCDSIWAFCHRSIEYGSPEELGLRNIYEQIFTGSGLTFSPGKLDFLPEQSEKRIPVAIQGKGNNYLWTISMLKRTGFEPACNIQAPLSVIVNETGAKWNIVCGDKNFTTDNFPDFATKIETLKNKILRHD